jgi:hypothetical protein
VNCTDDHDDRFEDDRWLWLDETDDADDLRITYGPTGPHLWRGRKWIPITDVQLAPAYQHAI